MSLNNGSKGPDKRDKLPDTLIPYTSKKGSENDSILGSVATSHLPKVAGTPIAAIADQNGKYRNIDGHRDLVLQEDGNGIKLARIYTDCDPVQTETGSELTLKGDLPVVNNVCYSVLDGATITDTRDLGLNDQGEIEGVFQIYGSAYYPLINGEIRHNIYPNPNSPGLPIARTNGFVENGLFYGEIQTMIDGDGTTFKRHFVVGNRLVPSSDVPSGDIVEVDVNKKQKLMTLRYYNDEHAEQYMEIDLTAYDQEAGEPETPSVFSLSGSQVQAGIADDTASKANSVVPEADQDIEFIAPGPKTPKGPENAGTDKEVVIDAEFDVKEPETPAAKADQATDKQPEKQNFKKGSKVFTKLKGGKIEPLSYSEDAIFDSNGRVVAGRFKDFEGNPVFVMRGEIVRKHPEDGHKLLDSEIVAAQFRQMENGDIEVYIPKHGKKKKQKRPNVAASAMYFTQDELTPVDTGKKGPLAAIGDFIKNTPASLKEVYNHLKSVFSKRRVKIASLIVGTVGTIATIIGVVSNNSNDDNSKSDQDTPALTDKNTDQVEPKAEDSQIKVEPKKEPKELTDPLPVEVEKGDTVHFTSFKMAEDLGYLKLEMREGKKTLVVLPGYSRKDRDITIHLKQPETFSLIKTAE